METGKGETWHRFLRDLNAGTIQTKTLAACAEVAIQESRHDVFRPSVHIVLGKS